MGRKLIRIWLRSDGKSPDRGPKQDDAVRIGADNSLSSTDSGGKDVIMEPDGIVRLTDKQRECLRHVFAHKSSKEIALLLRVEPGTVDQYIKAAIKILGVPDRRAAAIMLAQHEGRAAQPLAYQSPDIAVTLEPAMIGGSSGDGPHGRSSGERMEETQTAFVAAVLNRSPALPLPIGGARPDDVTWSKRLAWIAGITIGIALAFGGLVGGVEALTRLLES